MSLALLLPRPDEHEIKDTDEDDYEYRGRIGLQA
jgi:hypothetical protein